ncbi:hypothetical protein SAMD00023353_0800430 [Rosellinia necatrix]|uniref:Heterokaryon incompatibility domain-containing protein n=1 Tax=Rosellinia necatrix TaxID=77044 RepID=A0A1W2TAU0_ROSNE|nr:hypothetical protein SAMD00023353_0800430 [Rosellinia necatrix]
MCLSPRDLSHAPSGTATCVNTPQVEFEDPISGDRLCVEISTPLATPGYFRVSSSSRPPPSPSAGVHNKKPPASQEGCRNKDYTKRSRQSGDVDVSPTDEDDLLCYGQKVLAKVHRFFYFSGIQRCDNPLCLLRKRALMDSAPACNWAAFRDAIVTCIACREPAREINNLDPIIQNHKHNSNVVQWSKIPAVFCLDILGMFDVWVWATRLAFGPIDGMMEEWEMHRPIDFNQLWQGLNPGHSLRAVEGSRRLSEYGICLNRLWNVSLQSPNGITDISHVVDTALGAPLLGTKGKHSECTEEHCLYSHENSTLVRQAHKCPSGNCTDELIFPPDKLNVAFKNVKISSGQPTWYNTAWRLQTRKAHGEAFALCDSNTGYMAISHVWADGTGAGMKSPGQVNSCLYEYFKKIARRKECSCDGIWWDAISIPTERTARGAAINSMLENYQKAKITLVHDQDLVNFEWRDDGSPAVALILSSWFTRGWTAAELWASRSHPVKVVFKDPSSDEPLIKDLYDDIFGGDLSGWLFNNGNHPAGSPSFQARVLDPDGKIPTLGHLIATDILALLWRPETGNASVTTVGDLSSLLQILRPRTTSWARDRMIISGLMCLLPSEMDQSLSGSHITQRILAKIGVLKATELLNHNIPMFNIGPWDWCPQSIFDFAQSFSSNTASGDFCQVYPDGRLRGDFLAYEVLYSDAIAAYRPHPALAARVSVALMARNKCLLLTTPTIQQQQAYILFQPTYLNDRTITGRWIGSVSLKNALGNSRRNFHSGELGYGELEVEFGNDTSEIGTPLPIVSFQSVAEARLGFKRSRPRSAAPWLLSTHPKGGNFQLLPQTVYLYAENVEPTANIGKERRLFTHPMATMVINNAMQDESTILSTFVDELTKSLGSHEITPCHESHSYPCQGTVYIRWSFPYHQFGYLNCENIVRIIFLSKFHVTNSLANPPSDCQIQLGMIDFEEQILPNSRIESGKDGETERLFVATCLPCHECDACIKSNRQSKRGQI